MFEGEFTHEGDLCSFEVLVKQFFPADQALTEMGKIIHDLDFKDCKIQETRNRRNRRTHEWTGIGSQVGRSAA